MLRRYKTKVARVLDSTDWFRVPAYFYEDGVMCTLERDFGTYLVVIADTNPEQHTLATTVLGILFVEDILAAVKL